MINKRRVIAQIVGLNIVFIITSLLIYTFIEGSYNLVMVIVLFFYAILNVISTYLMFWLSENEYTEDLFYYHCGNIPNQGYLKTINKSYFKGDSFLLVSIILSNHEELVKAFDESFFNKIINEINERIKKLIEYKTITVSNNIRKMMLIIETNEHHKAIDSIMDLLEEDFLIEGIPVEIEYYIGFSKADNMDNIASDDLFEKSNAAAKYAINNDEKIVSFDEMQKTYRCDYNLLKLIPNAIEKKELFFEYQPIIPMEKEEFMYLEMLIRWKKDDMIIMPNHFIQNVQKTLLINDLSLYIIREAIDEINRYLTNGYKVAMSINVAAENLISEYFIEKAVNLIKNSGLSPMHFEFEITEGSQIVFSDKLISNILVLKELGIKVSIDDFGSGFSNLGYFNKMPIDYVKTDKELSRNINKDENANRLIRNLIVMFHELGYGVVCEGIETEEQFVFLAETEVDYLQGYYISRPLSSESAKEWVINNYDKYVFRE